MAGFLLAVVFFFQAEDGIRDWSVTGVQTCALPISLTREAPDLDIALPAALPDPPPLPPDLPLFVMILAPFLRLLSVAGYSTVVKRHARRRRTTFQMAGEPEKHSTVSHQSD